MKTSKAAPQSSAQEECGVWLDTVQLKEKAKLKRRTRPISKLLNPLAEGAGYSLAVALNFTQTKMEMPKTKQSSISAFFEPKRRVLHKMSSTEVPNLDPAQPSTPSTTTEPSPVSSMRKRARETCSENSDPEDSGPGVDCDSEKENMAGTEGTVWHKERTPCSALLKGNSVEFEPPQCKKRQRELSLLPGDSQTSPQPWSQDPLFGCSEYSEDFGSSDSSFLHSFENSEGFRNLIAVKGKTSTQRPVESHSHRKDDKENNRSASCNSPSKRITLSHLGTPSNHKWGGMNNVSPQKQPDPSGNNLVKDVHVDSLWGKSKNSPLKKQEKCWETDEDSFATLFTQDSEGFRVIAHRGLCTRSPLKDQSNLSTGVVRHCNYKSVEEEEEDDEMLFTQDSQGNIVIKH